LKQKTVCSSLTQKLTIAFFSGASIKSNEDGRRLVHAEEACRELNEMPMADCAARLLREPQNEAQTITVTTSSETQETFVQKKS